MKNHITLQRIWPILYAATLLAIVGLLNFLTANDQQYSSLTKAFLSGQLDLAPRAGHGWADTAMFADRHYSALGPLPAVLFAPLVWAGTYHQGLMAFFGTVGVFSQCLRLARNCHYSYDDACWFALAFCFGTSFVGVAALATSNHLAHIVAVLFLFLAINEYQSKSRLALVGSLIGLAMASRAPAGLNVVSFVLLIGFGGDTLGAKTAKLAKLLLPYFAIAGILAAYNFVRFQNPLESGYSLQLNGFGVPYATWDVPGNIAGPALRWSYIPEHLWIFLFGLPSYRGIGTSVLLVSPFLVYLGKVRWDLTDKLIALGTLPALLLILAFRSTGFEQMGYRFSLDFLPFAFWLLIRSRIPLTRAFKTLVFAATVLDMFLTFYHMSTLALRRQT